MSVLDDFVRMRELRKRAAEHEQAAADPSLPTDVRGGSPIGTSEQNAPAGVQKQTLVKYQRTIGLRPNKWADAVVAVHSFTHLLPLRSA